MSETIKQVMAQIFNIQLDSINDSSSPETIENWDSLKHMQLILALEDELEIQFPDEAIPDLVNYRAIEELIEKLSAT